MHHVAIMNPKLGFIDKILRGEKVIETRWYKHKITPWNKIASGDEIYFKNSGDDVRAKATVDKVVFVDSLNPQIVNELVQKYFQLIGLDDDIRDQFIKKHSDKNYAILIWLKNPKEVTPFAINKTGFGNAAAWLTLPKIESIVRIEK